MYASWTLHESMSQPLCDTKYNLDRNNSISADTKSINSFWGVATERSMLESNQELCSMKVDGINTVQRRYSIMRYTYSEMRVTCHWSSRVNRKLRACERNKFRRHWRRWTMVSKQANFNQISKSVKEIFSRSIKYFLRSEVNLMVHSLSTFLKFQTFDASKRIQQMLRVFIQTLFLVQQY